MKRFFSTIQLNRQISQDFYEAVFDWISNDYIPKPGQFLTIRVSDSTVPLLRRPFAFSGFDRKNNKASIIYQKRGKATEILAGRKVGDKMDIIGPMGNSFNIGKEIKKCIVVAGGIGLGPMVYTARYVKDSGKNVLFIFGARNKLLIPEKSIFNSLDLIKCTDDGSEGFKGTSVDYLTSLSESELNDAVILACGPKLMLKGCHEFAKKHNIQCHVSMEQIMACGVGACMGCVIKLVGKPDFARVCSEGPVFNSRDIIWT